LLVEGEIGSAVDGACVLGHGLTFDVSVSQPWSSQQ
jgi:hypothetical protein